MESNSSEEFSNIKSNLQFNKLPPPPVSGLFYMDMAPVVDLKAHSSSLDEDYKSIQTPYLDFFPLDILHEMKNYAVVKEKWDGKWRTLDSNYFQSKIERNYKLMRSESKNNIDDLMDYLSYLNGTFLSVNEPVEDYQILEEYPLIPTQDKFIVLTGDFADGDVEFEVSQGETTLVDKLQTGSGEYNSTKHSVDDKLCIEVRDGKAYYSTVRCVYKLTKAE